VWLHSFPSVLHGVVQPPPNLSYFFHASPPTSILARSPPSLPQELFVGRAAMLGVAFAIVGEILTGAGPLAQLGYEVRSSFSFA